MNECVKERRILSKAIIYLILHNKRYDIGCKLMVFTNRKSHTGFRLVPISVTSNDLELQRLFCVNSPISTRAVSAVAELLFYFCFSIMKNKADISAVTHGHNLPVRTNTGELFE